VRGWSFADFVWELELLVLGVLEPPPANDVSIPDDTAPSDAVSSTSRAPRPRAAAVSEPIAT
jgi:hypothetical protein